MLSDPIVPTQNQANVGKQIGRMPAKATAEVRRSARSAMALLVGSVLLSVCMCGQSANPAVPLTDAEINSSVPVKLPVAHAHFGSWCVGYLTISNDGIRFDAVRSHGKDQHSFQLKREQVQFLNYWLLGGQPMNAVEIRTGNKNYHFWLMQSEADLQASGWRPVAAGAADSLMLTLYYWRVTGNVPTLAAVNAALIQARVNAGNAALAQAGQTGTGTGTMNGDARKKVNDDMFINNVTSNVTSHTMSTISHMSHW